MIGPDLKISSMKIMQGIKAQIVVQMNSTHSHSHREQNVEGIITGNRVILNIIKETVGIENRFIKKVMIFHMMGKGTIIVKVKAGMVHMEVNSITTIVNKMNIINIITSKSSMVIMMTVDRKNSQRTGDQDIG
jgi:hypothetical protein